MQPTLKFSRGSASGHCHLAIALILPTAQFAVAQYTIDWSTIDGGGGTSTGGTYQVSGTIVPA